MAHLDLDTTALTGGAARARAAAATLTASPALGGTEAAGSLAAAGDLLLARALADLASAWTATRTGLADDLGGLAAGLAEAAEAFGSAEQVTVHRLGTLLAADGGDA